MKSGLRYTIVIAITLAIVAAGILLPSRIARLQDAQIIDRMRMEHMEESTAGYRHQLSIIEKLQILDYEQLDTIAITLDKGREMDSDTAASVCQGEIEALQEAGLIPELNIEDDRIFVMAVNYYLSTISPSQYVILWGLSLKINNGYGEFYLDDETGKILGFVIESIDVLPVTMTAEEAGNAWGDYLGLDLLNLEDMLGDKRKNQMSMVHYFLATYQAEDKTAKYPITVSENDRVFGAIKPAVMNYEKVPSFQESMYD